MPYNSNIKSTPQGWAYFPPGTSMILPVAVMVDGGGNVIATTDNGNGTANITATEVGNPTATLYSEALATRTASGTVGSLTNTTSIAQLQQMLLGINVTAASGTTPTLVVSLQEQDANQVWQTVASTPSITAAATAVVAAGPGMTNAVMLNGGPYRLMWTIAGTSPSFTFQMSLQAR